MAVSMTRQKVKWYLVALPVIISRHRLTHFLYKEERKRDTAIFPVLWLSYTDLLSEQKCHEVKLGPRHSTSFKYFLFCLRNCTDFLKSPFTFIFWRNSYIPSTAHKPLQNKSGKITIILAETCNIGPPREDKETHDSNSIEELSLPWRVCL